MSVRCSKLMSRISLLLGSVLASGITAAQTPQHYWRHPSLDDAFSPLGPGDVFEIQVAVDPAGNAIVVWNQDDGVARRIYMTEYSVQSRTWTSVTLGSYISLPESSADQPSVAMGRSGDALITWVQADPDQPSNPYINRVFRYYRPAGGDWPAMPTAISPLPASLGTSRHPKAAIDALGDAMLVWEHFDETDFVTKLYKSERRNNTWANPTLDEGFSPPDSSASRSDMAMGLEGGEPVAVVVWVQRAADGATFEDRLYMSEYRNGTWSHPTIDDFVNYQEAGVSDGVLFPAVATNSLGGAVVSYAQRVNGSSRMFVGEYQGVWHLPGSYNDSISSPLSPVGPNDVDMDNQGAAIIAWRQQDQFDHSQIFFSERRNGVWVHPSPNDLSDNISPDGSDTRNPSVSVGSAGGALIAWRQAGHVFASQYFDDPTQAISSAGAWTHPGSLEAHISPRGGGGVLTPRSAMGDTGHGIVVWMQNPIGELRCYRSEFR